MTDINQLLSILDSTYGPGQSQKNNEFLWPCPFCSHHKPKLAVNVASGQWHCWVCGVSGGSLFKLLKRSNASNEAIRRLVDVLKSEIIFEDEHTDDAVVMLPMEYQPLWLPSRNPEYKRAQSYLRSRNITDMDIIKYKLGYCTQGRYANRIIIPSYDADGKLNFFSARAYFETSFPYMNPKVSKNIVGFESFISWKFPVTICEGPMDAIAIRRNAIPLFGKSLPPKLYEQIITKDVSEVYLALDSDALRNALVIGRKLEKEDIKVYVVSLDGKDPGELGFSRMLERISGANEQLTFSSLIKTRISLI